MEANKPKTASLELPSDFESIVDLVEYSQHNTATCVSISMQKLGDTTCLFISADARVSHPKKLLKAKPGSTNSKTKFARGWQSLADKIVLLTKISADDEVTYKISVSLLEETSQDSDDEPCRLSGSVCFNSNFELLSGADFLPHALSAVNISKKKRLLRLLKMMPNEDDMLVLIPLKRAGSQTKIQVGFNDIVCEKTPITFSLKTYLTMAFLNPNMNITVEDTSVIFNLWVRSLTQSETRCFTLPADSSPSSFGSDDERDVKVLMTCGYTSVWPLHSCMLCYHRGRLVQYIVSKKRSRSLYKFLGVIHEIDVLNSPVQRKVLDVCIEHYVAETEVLRSRAIKVTKVDEEWKRCVNCNKWSQVTQPLEDGQKAICSNFNILISCEDAAGKLLPGVGSNKIPPTPTTSRKRKPATPATPSVRAGSPIELKVAKRDLPIMDSLEESEDRVPSSPIKSPVKSQSKSAKDKSPQKSQSPRKEKSPRKERSPVKEKSAKKKSAKKRVEKPPSPAGSRGSSVFEFHSGSEGEVVADSLSDGENLDSMTPALVPKQGSSLNNTGDTTILSWSTVIEGNGDGGTRRNNMDGYYSLSDDEDPKAMQIKQLKSELSRCQKRLEMLRSASTKFLDLLLISEKVKDGPVVKPDASPEEVVSILMSLVEDTEGLKSKLVRKKFCK